MPNNTNTNTTSTIRPFPKAYIGTVLTADSANSNVIINSKNVDIGSTNRTDKILNINNSVTTGLSGELIDNTNINLNSLILTQTTVTGTGETAITTDEIRLKSSEISIGKDGSSHPVIEIDGTNISFKNHKLQHLANAVEDDDALTLGQLNSKLNKIVKAIHNLNMSLAHVSNAQYGTLLPNTPALTPYTVTHLPTTNVDVDGITTVPTITLSDILALT